MRKLGAICSIAITVALFAICISVVAIRTLGLSTFVVTGGSMEPTIHKGSLVVVEPIDPSAVQLGDIITFGHYGQLTTHRVIAIDSGRAQPAFTTKGDANAVSDPEPISFPGQVGLVRLAIPLVGYAIAYVQAFWRVALTLVAGLVFFGCAAVLLFKRERRPAARHPKPAAVDPEEMWASHIRWLRERTAAQIRAA